MPRTSCGEVGIADQQVVEYVASVLTDFSAAGNWLALRDAEGRHLTSVVEMLGSQTGPPQTRGRVLGERELRKYVGDYTLFMSGLFRTFFERGGYLHYYLEERKHSYQTVSELYVAPFHPVFLIF